MSFRLKLLGGLALAAVLIIAPFTGIRGEPERSSAQVLNDLRDIEFTQIDYDHQADPYFGYIPGTIPILISAPHGAKHYRTKEHRWKDEDAYTSSLAIELGRMTGAHVLYLKNRAGEDPNNDPGTKYKEFLAKVVREHHIRFVLDLHGAAGMQTFKIDAGIIKSDGNLCSCPTYKPIIASVFNGFQSDLFNKRFSAGGNDTITGFARRSLGIEAAQIEINANYRIVESKSTGHRADGKKVMEVFGRLHKLILDINGKIASEPDSRVRIGIPGSYTIGSGGPDSSFVTGAWRTRNPQSVRENT